MTNEPWDWAEQRRDTEASFKELQKDSGLETGTLITLDLQFLPAETDSDEDALILALEKAGYEVTVSPEDDTVEASVADVPFSVEAIWKHEERTTKIALEKGYAPDGWGFWEPGGEDEDDELMNGEDED